MKKLIFFMFCLVATYAANSQNTTLSEVRELYQKSPTDKASCLELNKKLASINLDENIVLYGYKATAKMMMANYVSNPFSKLSYFNEGKKMLEKAIKKDNKNMELRFLRLSIQTNVPAFLGYNSNIETDKTFLNLSLPTLVDTSLKTIIGNYLNR